MTSKAKRPESVHRITSKEKERRRDERVRESAREVPSDPNSTQTDVQACSNGRKFRRNFMTGRNLLARWHDRHAEKENAQRGQSIDADLFATLRHASEARGHDENHGVCRNLDTFRASSVRFRI